MTFKPIPHRLEAILYSAITSAQDADVLPSADNITLPIQRSKKPEQGHYAVPCMALARPFGMKPIDIATTIADYLSGVDLIDRVEVAPPGFLNIFLSESWLLEQLDYIIQAGDAVFAQNMGEGRLANVEFVSANPTGPVHIGRTRGAVVGDTIGRLLEACGWRVHREYYFNNGGRQMQMLGESLRIRYLQLLGQDEALEGDHYQGDYLVDMAQTLLDEEGTGWQDKDWEAFKIYAERQIFKMIEATLARLGISFDHFFNELDLYTSNAVWDVRDRLQASGETYEARVRENAADEEKAEAETKGLEKATWFRSTNYGDDQDRVIVRGNGEPTYVLPDVAYHVDKIERGFDRIIDIFGSDHFTEAQTVDRALQALGYDTSMIDVVLHQWVQLVRGNEKVGMSTRKGQYVTLDDLIDEVGADVVRYFMLDRSADREINFDLDLAVKQSNENPVFYIQNAHVRCAGIFRQIEARGYDSNWDEGADITLLNDEERAFLMKMLELPDILHFAYETLAPHQLATWALDLARFFHPMYERSRVLSDDVDEATARARLRLYRAARIVFRRLLTIMGMSAPEVM